MGNSPTLTDKKCKDCGEIIRRRPATYVTEHAFTSLDGGGEIRIVPPSEYCPNCGPVYK